MELIGGTRGETKAWNNRPLVVIKPPEGFFRFRPASGVASEETCVQHHGVRARTTTTTEIMRAQNGVVARSTLRLAGLARKQGIPRRHQTDNQLSPCYASPQSTRRVSHSDPRFFAEHHARIAERATSARRARDSSFLVATSNSATICSRRSRAFSKRSRISAL